MLNSVRNHLGDLHGIGGRSSLLRQVSVSSHDNGVPKWLGLSSTPAGCLLPCIDQVYTLAVSMKLPPASRNASYTFLASSFAAPQPQSSPKVMVPSAASETRSPECPSSLYFTTFSFLEL